jgi:hypothetical protein
MLLYRAEGEVVKGFLGWSWKLKKKKLNKHVETDEDEVGPWA